MTSKFSTNETIKIIKDVVKEHNNKPLIEASTDYPVHVVYRKHSKEHGHDIFKHETHVLQKPVMTGVSSKHVEPAWVSKTTKSHPDYKANKAAGWEGDTFYGSAEEAKSRADEKNNTAKLLAQKYKK